MSAAPLSAAVPLEVIRSRGTVYGFEVRSTLPFQALRGGAGELLTVESPSRPGPRPDDELLVDIQKRNFHAQIFGDGATYKLHVHRAGWFEIDPRERWISAPEELDPILREELLWGVPALLCFLHRGDLSLHAAAIDVGGEAVLLAAPQAHGKSTLAAAFADRGHRVLAEDLTCVRVAGGLPAVIPGPATLRLRNDIGPEIQVRSGERLVGPRDRVRYALDSGSRGDCAPLPIKKLYFLRSVPEGIWSQDVDVVRALPDLWQFSFRVTRRQASTCFERIVDLAADVPIANLFRPLRIDALESTVDFVLDEG